jgi:FkbM family methyltransferase
MMISARLRTLAWRLGRKVYCWARGDLVNDPRRNGEHWLLRKMIEGPGGGGVLMDVGANVGDWSRHALAMADAANRQVSVYAFEPCSATCSILRHRLSTAANVEVVPLALSAVEGDADFFSNGAGLGTNSLNAVSGPISERVRLTTLDRFLHERNIERVAMLKIDTEGLDFDVLQGAQEALADGRIDLVQFEYNWRWFLHKASLLGVFNLMKDKPYRFGKLVGNSIAFYEGWHFELDRYFENNYVLVRRGSDLERLGRPWQFDAGNAALPAKCEHRTPACRRP